MPTFTIPMPQPGEVAAHTLGNCTMLVERNDTAAADNAFTPWTTYEPVDVRGGTRVHAAAVTHHRHRSVVSRWALCSVARTLRVAR